MICPQTPRISSSCSFVGAYPLRVAWVALESAIWRMRLEFWSTYKVSWSRSQSSALITTKSVPFRRVTRRGMCWVTTCSTKVFRLSRNLFTVVESMGTAPIRYGVAVQSRRNALTRQSSRRPTLRDFSCIPLRSIFAREIRSELAAADRWR